LSRIQAIINTYNKQRDLDPQGSVIIFDESVYFLNTTSSKLHSSRCTSQLAAYVLMVAHHQKSRAHYSSISRTQMVPRSCLCPRAARGIGLNVVSANVVIQCGPWWKSEWETQALKRAWRNGQLGEVAHVLIEAKNRSAEAYKTKIRDKKHRFNNRLVTEVPRPDGGS
jgi:hypothetical protein